MVTDRQKGARAMAKAMGGHVGPYRAYNHSGSRYPPYDWRVVDSTCKTVWVGMTEKTAYNMARRMNRLEGR